MNGLPAVLTACMVYLLWSAGWAPAGTAGTDEQLCQGLHKELSAEAFEGLYPRGRKFCFTFYSTKEADSIHTLRNGATAIGPYYGNQAEALSRAAEYGTFFIYKVNLPCMAGKSFLKPDFVMPNDETITSQTTAVVNAVKENKHIAFWDVVPEELRHWKKDELRYLELVSSAIRAADPYKRPVYMYEPNHRYASDLAKTIVYQDICAKGMYTEDVGMTESRIWCRWSMEQELEAIAGYNPSAAPWIVLWMAWDAGQGQQDLIDDWCRHDAYMGLIMGGKGIQIWSGSRGRKGFSDADFDAYLNGYLSVAKDLNGPLNLAPIFLFGKKKAGVSMNIVSGPQTLRLNYKDRTYDYAPVTYMAVVYQGKEYLFMVNSAMQQVTAVFGGASKTVGRDIFSGDTLNNSAGALTVSLSPLAVRGFCFPCLGS